MTGRERRLLRILCMTAGSGGGGGGGGNEYGVEWDYSNSSPVLTRIGDAAGFSDPVPATSLTGTGSSPFDSIMPWAGMKRYNIINGEVAWSEDDARYSETAYDTMVYIPEFYYSAIKDVENSVWTWKVSPTAKEGFEKHPGSGRYIGRFHTSGGTSGVFSKSGVAPMTGQTIGTFRSYSHSKSDKWWMIDIATWSAVQLLYLIEFANFNSQQVLGRGQNTGSPKNTGYTTDAMYHTIKKAGESNQYRWLENPFSNVRIWVDGCVSDNQFEVYAGIGNASFDGTTRNLTKSNIRVPAGGYISGFGYSSVFPWVFVPDTTNGSASTYVTDYGDSNTGSNVLMAAGSCNSQDYWGMFYFDISFASNRTSATTGSRLIYIP